MGARASSHQAARTGCLIVASGPSASQSAVDHLAKSVSTVCAVNDGYRLAPGARWIYAADWQWWRHHLPAITAAGFAGELYGTRECAVIHEPRIQLLTFAQGPGLSDTQGTLKGGIVPFSGAQAINLAYLQGYRRIVLLGFDMRKRTHFFGDHPEPLNRNQDYDWASAARGLGDFAADLANRGVRVLNASPKSALPYWPRMTVDEAAAAV